MEGETKLLCVAGFVVCSKGEESRMELMGGDQVEESAMHGMFDNRHHCWSSRVETWDWTVSVRTRSSKGGVRVVLELEFTGG